MAKFRRRSLFKAIGSLAGAVIGGVVLGGIGVRALDNSPGFLSGIAFFVSFIGMLFGFVAPLALVRYLGGRGNSRIAKELSTGGGYVAMMVVIVVVAGAALFLAPPRLKRNPQVGVVAFDIVGGVVFGGIVGREVISRWL